MFACKQTREMWNLSVWDKHPIAFWKETSWDMDRGLALELSGQSPWQ